jgi:tRNA1Val (adenine37-N6)-methyltransferase
LHNINKDERIDDLQYKGLKIIQKQGGFCFGIDAVLLANFIKISSKKLVLDLGTGTGIIPILLAGKTKAKKIIGIDIQAEMVELAKRSVTLNNLEDRIEIQELDIRNAKRYFKGIMFDVIVTNPPYFKKGCGILNPNDPKAISRHEILCNLEDVIKTSSELLAFGGDFVMVHRPDRLVDIMYFMRLYGIEPKVIQMVYPYEGKNANIVLIKAKKGGNPELKTLPPLYVYNKNGEYTKEINDIYERGELNSGR